MRRAISKFSPELLKVSELEHSWDPLIESRKCMNLTFTEELCVMTMKKDAEFEKELIFLCNLCNLFSYARDALVTNLFHSY